MRRKKKTEGPDNTNTSIAEMLKRGLGFRQTGLPAKFHRSSLRRDGKGYYPRKLKTEDGCTVLQMQHSGTAYVRVNGGLRRVQIEEATA